MTTAPILHRVNDFDTFKQVYDSVARMQAAGGVTAQPVHRMAGDPDNVLVIHEFDPLDSARSLFADPQLRDAMVRGGVRGEARIELVHSHLGRAPTWS